MKRLAALFLAAVVVAGVTGPAFAAGSMGEFSPGDDPPWSSRGEERNRGCANGLDCGAGHPPANEKAFQDTNPGNK